MSTASGRFGRTKVITLLPKHVVVNLLSRPLLVGQAGCEEVAPARLDSGEAIVVRRLHESAERRIKLRLCPDSALDGPGLDWHWTDALPVGLLGSVRRGLPVGGGGGCCRTQMAI